MSGTSIFGVDCHDLNRLDAREAVDCFRRLLWAEAHHFSVAKALIDVPLEVNVADGGIDASLDVPKDTESLIVRSGVTRFQIKTGGFSASGASEVGDLICDSKGGLKPRVRSCLECGGRFVVVLFGSDKPDRADAASEEAIRRKIEEIDPRLKDCTVEVWRQNKLISFLERFPSLCFRLSGRESAALCSHDMWGRQDDMQGDFHPGDCQQEQITDIREALRLQTEACHIHVCGEPGIGKTRLVYEALDVDELRGTVIYFHAGHRFLESRLLAEMPRSDNVFEVILVLDECDATTRAGAWNRCKDLGKRVALITIYNEFDRATGRTRFVQLGDLPVEQVSAIIQDYGVPKHEAGRWSGFCGGSPRFAHLLGMNLREHVADLFQEPDTETVWKLCIVGNVDESSAIAERREVVLRHLALFKRFGIGPHFEDERAAIVALVQAVDPQITQNRFDEIVKHYRDRRILQGEHTLYITAKLLHIKLWRDWWENYGGGRDPHTVFDELCEALPEQLVTSLQQMFAYGRSSPVARRLVGELLGDNGPFLREQNRLNTLPGSRLFLTLTEADPQQALRVLNRTLGSWSLEQARSLREGRRNIVCALERIAVWRSLFADAARLLLLLAEAENEKWANSATGVFCGLFSLAHGPVAPTEAPPEERITTLKEALRSAAPERRALALRAFESALSSIGGHGRLIGFEYQGLRATPSLWSPETYGELWEAYRLYWAELENALTVLHGPERQECAQILVEAAAAMIRSVPRFDVFVTTLERLYSESLVDKKLLLTEVVGVLRLDAQHLDDQQRTRLGALRDRITGTSFEDRLRRFVGLRIDWEDLNDNGKEDDTIKEKIVGLAEETVRSPDLLRQQLAWLVTEEVENGVRFGEEVARRDQGFQLLAPILAAQKSHTQAGSPLFLGGYLRGIAESDPERWEETLDRIAEDPPLAPLVPELTRRCRLTDRSVGRVSRLVSSGVVRSSALALFAWGRDLGQTSEECAEQLFRALVALDDAEAPFVLINLLDAYYVRSDEGNHMPREIARIVLLNAAFFGASRVQRLPQMAGFHWTRVAKAYAEAHPDGLLEIAAHLIDHFGDTNSVAGRFRSSGHEVLNLAVVRHPEEVWRLLSDHLSRPFDTPAYDIGQWLRGGNPADPHPEKGAVDCFPRDIVLKWADEDAEARAPVLARFVTPTLVGTSTTPSLAREVLARYGDREAVQGAVFANFLSGTWWGPEHVHLETQQERFAALRPTEQNPNVRRWIDDYISYLEERIREARVREERDAERD